MEKSLFDRNSPQGAKSLSNLRNSNRGLFQGDLMHMQPKAALLIEDFEYPTDASIQAAWSGTGCTVTAEAAEVEKGNFAGNVAVDVTGNRTVSKSHIIDLSIFDSVTVWEQVNVVSSDFQFYVKDSSANESYWDITSNGTQDTWQKDTLDLLTADSNNGTDANLSDIIEYGYLGLDASKTYIFDDITLISGMGIIVETTNPGSYYKNVWLGSSPIEKVAQASPALIAPSGNSRIDILVIDTDGVLAWVEGSEAATPVPDWASVATVKMPIALVYLKTTMVKVVDFEDAAANPNEGYIYADVRPLYMKDAVDSYIQDADGDTKIQCEESADEDIVRIDAAGSQVAQFDVNGLTLAAGASVNELSTDALLAGNSDAAVPTEKVVKTYVDAKGFKDRGDPATSDYELGDLVENNDWNELDLSGIVPAGAVVVYLDITYTSSVVGSEAKFRKNGNTHAINISAVHTQVANITMREDVVVPCDANQIIEYWLTSTATTAIKITVKAWGF